MYKILVLYDVKSMHVGTIFEHLSSYQRYSQNEVYYASATHDAECNYDLSNFDVLVLHYSIRVSLTWHLSSKFSEAIKKYQGHKILYIQDEYDCTETARTWIENLNIDTVFTCVPKEYVNSVYPTSRFPGVSFKQTLTGYIPIDHKNLTATVKPISERHSVIGYRGRNLPFWYGNLGREKAEIAEKMKSICEERSIAVDIEWDDSKRIYGPGWFEFIARNKATLGTESGSNIFDDYGHLKDNIELEIKENPEITYEEIFQKYLTDYEGKVVMNQISPRIFESIVLKTALVLYEGNYSGVIKPHQHFIPLKKDFSNIDEVLNKVTNDDFLSEMTERAYDDIVVSGKYTYLNFINEFDNYIKDRVVLSSNSKKIPMVHQSLEENIKLQGRPKLFEINHELREKTLRPKNFWSKFLNFFK